MQDVRFEIPLSNGRVAACWEAQHQEYQDCVISAGLVEGIPPDAFYLRFARSGEEPTTIFMRSDEALAIVFCVSGALWSADIMREPPQEGDMMTIAELAELVDKPQETIRQRIYQARKRGILKKWRRSGWVILVDREEGLRLARPDFRRGRRRTKKRSQRKSLEGGG